MAEPIAVFEPQLVLTLPRAQILVGALDRFASQLRVDGLTVPDELELMLRAARTRVKLAQPSVSRNGTSEGSETERPVTIARMTSAQVADRLDVDRHSVTRPGRLRDRLGGRQGPTGRWCYSAELVEAEARRRGR